MPGGFLLLSADRLPPEQPIRSWEMPPAIEPITTARVRRGIIGENSPVPVGPHVTTPGSVRAASGIATPDHPAGSV
jgi:hypothetical protein